MHESSVRRIEPPLSKGDSDSRATLGEPSLPSEHRREARSGHPTAVGEWQKSAWGDGYKYQNYFLSRVDYEAFRDAFLAVKEHLMGEPAIGVGRSPTSMMAVLGNLSDIGTSINLPLSDFRFRPEGENSPEIPPPPYDNSRTSNRFRPLSTLEEGKLFEHFDLLF